MKDIQGIGAKLTEYAELQAEFTAQRGLLDELFPFIYMASKRMSLRAICRWLKDNQRIEISVNAVARAMRNQEAYWAELVEEVEPSARVFAEAHDVEPSRVLDEEECFNALEITAPFLSVTERSDIANEFGRVEDAARVIRNRWFVLPEEVRNQCRRYFPKIFYDESKAPKGGVERAKRKTKRA